MNRDPVVERRAARLYEDSLPYHNFSHALKVIAAGGDILEKCRREDIRINEDIIYYAMLLHDAGYHEDAVARGFRSKEGYSAHLAVQLLGELKVPAEVIAGVQSAILSTHIDGHCNCNEDRLVRLADLSGMAADYEVFREDSINLKREHELLNHRNVSWRDWKLMARETVEWFIREDICLTSDYYDAQGDSRFHSRVRSNLESLMSDPTLT